MSRSCSKCGKNCHNSGNCSESIGGGDGGGTADASAATAAGGIMLFGVRVTEGHFRKSASTSNLSLYEQPQDSNSAAAAADGYASDDAVHASARSRERKRGVPWTEEEHKLFLLGLQKVGKGDWRGISRNFVKTRTPTQVASHAQKYFLRRGNHTRRRRRSSLFDMTTETFLDSAIDKEQVRQRSPPQPPPRRDVRFRKFPASAAAFPVTFAPAAAALAQENARSDHEKARANLIRPMPLLPFPPSSKMGDLSLSRISTVDPLPLSLELASAPSDQSFSGSGESVISVA